MTWRAPRVHVQLGQSKKSEGGCRQAAGCKPPHDAPLDGLIETMHETADSLCGRCMKELTPKVGDGRGQAAAG